MPDRVTVTAEREGNKEEQNRRTRVENEIVRTGVAGERLGGQCGSVWLCDQQETGGYTHSLRRRRAPPPGCYTRSPRVGVPTRSPRVNQPVPLHTIVHIVIVIVHGTLPSI